MLKLRLLVSPVTLSHRKLNFIKESVEEIVYLVGSKIHNRERQNVVCCVTFCRGHRTLSTYFSEQVDLDWQIYKQGYQFSKQV